MRNPRKSLAKALRKLNPDHAELVMSSVDALVDKLESHGFHLTGSPSDGVSPFWHRLLFERAVDTEAFAYIDVGFADDGSLSFGSAFGIRDYAEPNDWHCDGNLSKCRFGLWRTCDLGAAWPLRQKQQMFIRDWEFLMSNVDGIVHFLETGEANKNIADAMVTERFRPRS